MVERGERPDFQAGAPEIEKAPNFSEGGHSSNPEQDSAGLPSAISEITPAPSVSSPESSSPSDGQLEVPGHSQTVGFKEIPTGEDTIGDQAKVEAVFKGEASSE